MLPSASDLRYFVEVASTLNISRAAERLGVSQPSLSLAIQRLENAVGTSILNRTKRGVLLTQAGKQLLAHSKHLLQSWDQVCANALASVNEIQGTIVLGSHPSVSLYTLSAFLPHLLETHPKLNIQLKHDLSRKITEGVISSKIDIGIVVNPVRHPDLVIYKLCDDEVSFWVDDGKRAIQDFRGSETVLIYDPDLIQSQTLLKLLKKNGIEIARTLESSSLEVITDLTSNSCGIGILPSRVAALSKKKLKRIAKAPIFNDEICLLFRVENKNVKAIQTICNSIKEALSQRRPLTMQ